MSVPVLSKYASTLESHVKSRYLQKIEAVGIDPASIPSEQFDPECLPPIEQSDLFSYPWFLAWFCRQVSIQIISSRATRV
jgi:hypothetical protein